MLLIPGFKMPIQHEFELDTEPLIVNPFSWQNRKARAGYIVMTTGLVACVIAIIILAQPRLEDSQQPGLTGEETTTPVSKMSTESEADVTEIVTEASLTTTGAPDTEAATVPPGVVNSFQMSCMNSDATILSCQQMGCLWQNDEAPQCYHPTKYSRYAVRWFGEAEEKYFVMLDAESSYFDQVQKVVIVVSRVDNDVVRIQVKDEMKSRWQQPLPQLNLPDSSTRDAKYDVSVNQHQLVIVRRSTSAVIFETDLRNVLLSDSMIRIENLAAKTSIYGLGLGVPIESGGEAKGRTQTVYHVFSNSDPRRMTTDIPFYMTYEGNTGDSHGVLLFNSNPMDIIWRKNRSITYQATGGIFDFFLCMGPDPVEVVRQKANIVGKPLMPPYWSLGTASGQKRSVLWTGRGDFTKSTRRRKCRWTQSGSTGHPAGISSVQNLMKRCTISRS